MLIGKIQINLTTFITGVQLCSIAKHMSAKTLPMLLRYIILRFWFCRIFAHHSQTLKFNETKYSLFFKIINETIYDK
ncbi:hypothetical protein BpHYR1_047081 [Brachionus plicatilis]|uniref:Uncharacterized protein n=1 Tax=Brachionus plicatilis TaxID=10195 RepID=A0A3M7QV81_BRAPC|nr:hypothetical protein BpHYR1_047081 [Brachionus plicatilis]